MRILWLLCALGLAVAAPSARAQPKNAPADDAGPVISDEEKKRGKALFVEGQRLFELRRFAEALEKYQQAYEAAPLPALLFNIGQAYVNLDQLDAALFSFRRYLTLAPRAFNREAVLAYIEKIEKQQREREAAAEKRRQQPVEPAPVAWQAPRSVPPATPRTPVYKRWWFWGGLAALAGAGAATAVVLTSDDGPPDTTLGNINFP